jgi:hypothetical protein
MAVERTREEERDDPEFQNEYDQTFLKSRSSFIKNSKQKEAIIRTIKTKSNKNNKNQTKYHQNINIISSKLVLLGKIQTFFLFVYTAEHLLH